MPFLAWDLGVRARCDGTRTAFLRLALRLLCSRQTKLRRLGGPKEKGRSIAMFQSRVASLGLALALVGGATVASARDLCVSDSLGSKYVFKDPKPLRPGRATALN